MYSVGWKAGSGGNAAVKIILHVHCILFSTHTCAHTRTIMVSSNAQRSTDLKVS